MIFQAKAVSKDYLGFEVLKGVSFQIERPGIYGLIGPNGAGKTTLFNIISRVIEASSGELHFEDNSLLHFSAYELALRGVCRTFQLKSALEHITTRENILAAIYSRENLSFNLIVAHNTSNYKEEVERILSEFNLLDVADRPAAHLSYGQKKILEIATTRAFNPRLLLLDEPLAGVGLTEIESIKAIIRSIARTSTVLVIDHNMHFIKELCDKIFVLHQGKIICEGSFDELRNNPEVMLAYLGETKA